VSGKQTPVQPTRTGDQRIDGPMRAVASNINELIGATSGAEELVELQPDATLQDVISRLNIIIRRLSRA